MFVVELNPAGGPAPHARISDGAGLMPAWSPDGRWLAWSDRGNTLRLEDRTGNSHRNHSVIARLRDTSGLVSRQPSHRILERRRHHAQSRSLWYLATGRVVEAPSGWRFRFLGASLGGRGCQATRTCSSASTTRHWRRLMSSRAGVEPSMSPTLPHSRISSSHLTATPLRLARAEVAGLGTAS